MNVFEEGGFEHLPQFLSPRFHHGIIDVTDDQALCVGTCDLDTSLKSLAPRLEPGFHCDPAVVAVQRWGAGDLDAKISFLVADGFELLPDDFAENGCVLHFAGQPIARYALKILPGRIRFGELPLFGALQDPATKDDSGIIGKPVVVLNHRLFAIIKRGGKPPVPDLFQLQGEAVQESSHTGPYRKKCARIALEASGTFVDFER